MWEWDRVWLVHVGNVRNLNFFITEKVSLSLTYANNQQLFILFHTIFEPNLKIFIIFIVTWIEYKHLRRVLEFINVYIYLVLPLIIFYKWITSRRRHPHWRQWWRLFVAHAEQWLHGRRHRRTESCCRWSWCPGRASCCTRAVQWTRFSGCGWRPYGDWSSRSPPMHPVRPPPRLERQKGY